MAGVGKTGDRAGWGARQNEKMNGAERGQKESASMEFGGKKVVGISGVEGDGV